MANSRVFFAGDGGWENRGENQLHNLDFLVTYSREA
jgi:hypothetical protein